MHQGQPVRVRPRSLVLSAPLLSARSRSTLCSAERQYGVSASRPAPSLGSSCCSPGGARELLCRCSLRCSLGAALEVLCPSSCCSPGAAAVLLCRSTCCSLSATRELLGRPAPGAASVAAAAAAS